MPVLFFSLLNSIRHITKKPKMCNVISPEDFLCRNLIILHYNTLTLNTLSINVSLQKILI